MGVARLASSDTRRSGEREKRKKTRESLPFPIFIQNKTNKSSFPHTLSLSLSSWFSFACSIVHISDVFLSVLYLVGFFSFLVLGLMMIIQDENRLKEEEEEEQEQQEVKEEEQESSRMSTEMNSTVKAAAAAAAEEDVHDLSLSNGKKTVSPDLGKSANRRKQVKPNR